MQLQICLHWQVSTKSTDWQTSIYSYAWHRFTVYAIVFMMYSIKVSDQEISEDNFVQKIIHWHKKLSTTDFVPKHKRKKKLWM